MPQKAQGHVHSCLALCQVWAGIPWGPLGCRGSKSCSVQGCSWPSEAESLGTPDLSPLSRTCQSVSTAIMPLRSYFPDRRCLRDPSWALKQQPESLICLDPFHK